MNWESEEALDRFKEIIFQHGWMRARDYDALKTQRKPGRCTLQRRFNCSWSDLLDMAGAVSEGADSSDSSNDISIEYNPGSGTAFVSTKSLKIQTLEQALEAAEVNLDEWEVSRYLVNSWEVTMGGAKTAIGTPETYTNFQVKVWLKRKAGLDAEETLARIIKKMEGHSPKYKPIKRPKPNPIMSELCFMDLHNGKYAWGEETGTDYDSEIAARLAANGLEDLLSKILPFKPEYFLLPTGNDLLNVDTPTNTTARGTAQDVDDRPNHVFESTVDLVVSMVDRLRYYAPVKVKMVPGNHDPQSIFHLGAVLKAWYRSAKDVDIDNSPKTRKYERYGVNLIGYVHGDQQGDPAMKDLPLIMAQEVPEEWAKATFKEWHLGHFHKKKETAYIAGDTFNGVLVKIIPSLVGTDAWHYRRGFVKGRRAAEAYVWDKENGPVGYFSTYVN